MRACRESGTLARRPAKLRSKDPRILPSAPLPPRIGLALGGGFALGIAYAGVLEVFEMRQIPIHCITGVSAGSVYLVDEVSDVAGWLVRRQTLLLQVTGDGRMITDNGRTYHVRPFPVQPGQAQVRNGRLELPKHATAPRHSCAEEDQLMITPGRAMSFGPPEAFSSRCSTSERRRQLHLVSMRQLRKTSPPDGRLIGSRLMRPSSDFQIRSPDLFGEHR